MSLVYHSQANGQAKSSNKMMKHILKMIVIENPRDHHTKLDSMLWDRSEEHTSELQSLRRNSYAVFC